MTLSINYVYDGSNWVRKTVGTAGTAAAQVVTIQGIASMTPILATVTATNLVLQSGGADLATSAQAGAIQTAVELLDNAVSGSGFNISQINGVTPLMGAGNTGTGSPRVTIATDQAAVAGLGVYAEDTADADGSNLTPAGAVRRNAAASSTSTDGDRATINTDTLGLLWTRQLDPCSGVAKVYYPVNISTATTTEIVNGAGASTHVYICSILLHTDAANDVALVEDDTDACASPAAGIIGGTTTGAGLLLAASSGLAMGNGQGSIAKTATVNYYVCLITSAATQLTGVITYALAP
jgi:hypothetical protein